MDSDAPDKKQTIGGDDSKDIISTLPEEILSLILSVLPTKDAVRTCVLSTKWIYKWTCITNLDVDDQLLYSKKKRTRKAFFINFMNRVLSHIQSSTINNVSLRFSYDYRNEESILNSWISAVLNKRVRKLDIQYLYDDPIRPLDFILPCSFFRSETLQELKLKLENYDITVPSNNILPSLQILKIFRINFVNNSLSEPTEISLRFPVLKDFHMANCTWFDVQTVIFVAPQVEKFSADWPKFEWLNADARNSVIYIIAMNLKIFSYRGFLNHGLIFSNPTSVTDAYLDIWYEYGKIDDAWHQAGLRACKLITAFKNLKFLKLACRTVQALADATSHVSTLPLFGSLVSLELDMNGLLTSQNMLFILLHKTPVLERLSFQSDPPNSAEDFLTSMVVPYCFTSSLKVVEFKLFNQLMLDLSLPIYVIQNTTFLECMTVRIKVPYKTGEIKNIIEHVLLSSPRASRKASMEVQEMTLQELRSL